jgi:hypothetical protein
VRLHRLHLLASGMAVRHRRRQLRQHAQLRQLRAGDVQRESSMRQHDVHADDDVPHARMDVRIVRRLVHEHGGVRGDAEPSIGRRRPLRRPSSHALHDVFVRDSGRGRSAGSGRHHVWSGTDAAGARLGLRSSPRVDDRRASLVLQVGRLRSSGPRRRTSVRAIHRRFV